MGALPTEYPRYVPTNIKLTYIIIPYAETPFAPANSSSFILNRILTKDIDRFVTISDEPLVQVFIIGDNSKRVLPNRNLELFFDIK